MSHVNEKRKTSRHPRERVPRSKETMIPLARMRTAQKHSLQTVTSLWLVTAARNRRRSINDEQCTARERVAHVCRVTRHAGPHVRRREPGSFLRVVPKPSRL